MQCQICEGATEQFLDLGKQPPCDFLAPAELDREISYRLTVHFCPDCSLVQLGEPLDQATLFTPAVGYHHVTALSSSFLKHLDDLAAATVARFNLSAGDLMVEIGSNDGALLAAFHRRGVRVLGVDPSDVAALASVKGLPTVRRWFDEALAAELAARHGQAQVITALNTFAHVAAPDSVVRGINRLLTPDGVFISENHYLLDLIQQLQYDFIYHEHSRYYTLRSLQRLFDRFALEIFDVERIPTHSGSLRVFACRQGVHPISAAVAKLLAIEAAGGLHTLTTYQVFARQVKAHQLAFRARLRDLRANGQTIAGLTFPARAVTLLNGCALGPETLCYITELSERKIGRCSPGTHIPVVDQAVLFGDQAPDYGLLLSWHLQDELIPRFRAKGFKGKFIIPLPTPLVLS